jgi:hypothetical protein
MLISRPERGMALKRSSRYGSINQSDTLVHDTAAYRFPLDEAGGGLFIVLAESSIREDPGSLYEEFL